MEDIKRVIDELIHLVESIPNKIAEFSEHEITHKPSPEKWSKKEILGHLCDSCLNNLQRIIRVQYEDKPLIIYNQDEWVKIQDYQSKSIEGIVELWKSLHLQFLKLLKTFPKNKLESILDIGKEVTARFIITDYLRHQNHHLQQIFGD